MGEPVHPYDLAATLQRVADMQRQAVPDSKAAFAQFWRTYGAFPYWVNRLGPMRAEALADDLVDHVWEVVMRLVIGHLTEGYEGALEGRLPGYIDQALAYFGARARLQRDGDDAPLPGLAPEGAAVARAGGYQPFRIGAGPQIGVEIVLEVPFRFGVAPAV